MTKSNNIEKIQIQQTLKICLYYTYVFTLLTLLEYDFYNISITCGACTNII